jgi:cell division protein FtsL
LALLIGVVALSWIRKEVYHDQLSRQILALEKKETVLLTEAGHLQQQYMLLCESSRIEKIAREKLNMEFPKTVCDTVWNLKPDRK